ncbi:MAG TPA: arginine--tRNA ligase, partial [Phytomonospora sp.]
MTPEMLAEHVLTAAQAAFAALELDPSALPSSTTVERPRQPEHGDYASTLCLQLAKKVGRPPRALAEAISAELGKTAGIASVEIAGPGFLNIRLDASATGQIAGSVVAAGDDYGKVDAFAGQRLNLEFVSANPTGPVHIGGVRWAAVGDALGRILKFAGAEVTTEYYFNDAGTQIDHFAASLLAAAKGEPTPENGYQGEYIGELAATIVEANPDWASKDDPREFFRVEGITLMFAEVKKSLADFGTHFDVYFNERDLHVKGELDRALARLREQGNIYEKDGAVWLRSSDYGDDKDRVIVRSNGSWTYFAADCAYYLDKRERGFDKVVIMLGADHHGYIGRMKAMVSCFGDDPSQTLEILIGQMV